MIVVQVQAWREAVADRLAQAEAADPGTDPIEHRLDEYRACIAELDAWVSQLEAEGDTYRTGRAVQEDEMTIQGSDA